MTPIGGGSADIQELLRAHGKEAIYRLAESSGLKRVRDHIQCPFKGCQGRGPDRSANVSVFSAERGTYKLKCHSCSSTGDLLDMLEQLNGWTKPEAIAHLRGLAAPTPRPNLRIVSPAIADNPDKLKPAEVRRVWDMLATDDELGHGYLEGRALADSPFVRFATEAVADPRVKNHAKNGRRIGMLLTSVTGDPRGIQFRLVREPEGKESKQMFLKGSSGRGAFFGQPELVEAAPLVLVAEGMADTLALKLWAGEAGVVVGAPGKDALPGLAEELKSAGIPVDGKLFCLFPQNDKPKNVSRNAFTRLAQLLSAEGAHVVFCNTDAEWKDVARWRQAEPELPWPPAELAKAVGGEPGDEGERPLVLPQGSAVPIPTEFRTDRYAQNLSTLLALLDDPAHREAVTGRGELQMSDMTGEITLDGRELKGTDLTALRYRLEQQRVGADNKPLKFTRTEVEEALEMLASRKRFHKLTDWVRSLKWNGVGLIDNGLPQALNQVPGSLTARLVRKWFVSAAARALQPGCKVDTVLVLIGPQGCGKSRFCRAVGGPWFTDAKVDVESDNGKRLMRRSWIVEWAELTAMRRARDAEAIKQFLSQQVDVYRPLYREQPIEAPRHSVIVGTTNDDEFLRDPTGSRRFWPVRVSAIDVAWIVANREQLLAEAAAAVQAGEQWWLDGDDEAELEHHNKEFQVEDDWTEIIQEFNNSNLLWVESTTAQILEGVIKKDKDQWTQADHNRVSDSLKSLGWTRHRQRVPGQKARPAVWRPPAR